MKPFLFLAMMLAFATVACKKAEAIEQAAQSQRDGYTKIATIRGNTLYRINDTYVVYILINDEDSSKFSISR